MPTKIRNTDYIPELTYCDNYEYCWRKRKNKPPTLDVNAIYKDKNGKRIRRYLRRKNCTMQEYLLHDWAIERYYLLRSFPKERNIFTTNVRTKPGRKPVHDPVLRELMLKCGLSVVGSTIRKSRKYFTAETASWRFALLSDEDKALVKSPKNLLALCIKAQKKLKSCNRNKIPSSYDTCFQEALNESLNSNSC